MTHTLSAPAHPPERFDQSLNKNLPELDRRGEISSVLKLAVNSVHLGLCDSCNYFACPLLIVQKNYILTYIRKKSVY